MLILSMKKKKEYDMIISGEKTVEYRKASQYLQTKIMEELGFYDKINFENRKPVKIENVYIRYRYGRPTAKISATVQYERGYYVFTILKVQELEKDNKKKGGEPC